MEVWGRFWWRDVLEQSFGGKGRKVDRREGSVPLRAAHTHAGHRGPTSPSCSELLAAAS